MSWMWLILILGLMFILSAEGVVKTIMSHKLKIVEAEVEKAKLERARLEANRP